MFANTFFADRFGAFYLHFILFRSVDSAYIYAKAFRLIVDKGN